MRMFKRLILLLLTLAFAGGSNACVAACARSLPVKVGASQSATCRHCISKPAEKTGKRIPGVPCRNCQNAVQDRMSGDRDAGFACGFDLWGSPCISGDEGMMDVARVFVTPRHLTHWPPGELLHHLCVLLI